MSDELSHIATDFRGLAELLKEHRLRCNKSSHLVENLLSLQVQAGRLLYEAIRNNAFPKECIDVNGQWWDCESNRLPGGPFTESNQTPTNNTYALIWLFTISSWLTKAFPSRFRNKAASWDWKHVATDTEGRPVGKDGQPLRRRWYKNKKLLPENFVYDSDHHTAGDKYECKFEGELMHVHEGYDESDALEHARVRTEVYANACTVLAELIELRIAPQSEVVDTATANQAADISKRDSGRSLPVTDVPNSDGYVKNPSDPSVYVPVKTILADYTVGLLLTPTEKMVGEIVGDFAKNNIRWTRPISKLGTPMKNRRSVHLTDWVQYVNRLTGGRSERHVGPDPTEKQILEDKAAIRRAKGH